MLDLNHIELATQEDLDSERDVWARLFQAKTRGDLMRIAQQCEELKPVIDKMDVLMADDAVRLQYDAEETLRNREKGIRKKIHRLEEELADKDERLLNQEARIAELEAKLEELQK